MDYGKQYILQNSIENMVIDYLKISDLTYYDAVSALESVSNTFRKMLLTKIAYDSSIKVSEEHHSTEEKNETISDSDN